MGWDAILDGALWESVELARSGFPLRTVALELSDGGVVVMSPTRGLDIVGLEAHAGRVRVLFAPNHFHHLGIPTWAEACPSAAVVCSSTARSRLAARVEVPWEDLETLAALLPDGASVEIPPGTRSGEAWLFVERGEHRVLIVSDAFFNVDPLPPGLIGWFLRATRAGPGLSLGTTFKLLALRDRQAYRGWTRDFLARRRPNVLVPGHGSVIRGEEVASRLIELLDRRLGPTR